MLTRGIGLHRKRENFYFGYPEGLHGYRVPRKRGTDGRPKGPETKKLVEVPGGSGKLASTVYCSIVLSSTVVLLVMKVH
jgi:hypothetical protein